MKYTKTKTVLALALFAAVASSCQDWLTLYPQDKVTEEQFWEDKNDLEGVRYAAYRNFASNDMINKIINWGEVRGDNFMHNTINNSPNWQNYEDIMTAQLDTACALFDWASLYTTINYCNKVLQHGEEVLAKDKQFTRSQWNAIKAEMVTLRALNYFYLIRAFSDVPLTFTSIDRDAEVTSIPQTPMIDVLNAIIEDVDKDEIKTAATMNRTTVQDTKTTITRPAVYALLADMYLWRASYLEGRNEMEMATADYTKAVEYAQESRNLLKTQNESDEQSGLTSTDLTNDPRNPYNLIQNYPTVKSEATDVTFRAFSQIFLTGYSKESIFEMSFTISDKMKNDAVNTFFTDKLNDKTCFAANREEMPAGTDDPKDLRYRICTYKNNTDSKYYDLTSSSLTSSTGALDAYGYVMKYRSFAFAVDRQQSTGNTQSQLPLYTFVFSDEPSAYTNFIIYRISDVLLIEAEAQACLGNLQEAANIIYEVDKRWSEDATKRAGSAEEIAKTVTRDDMIKQVMDCRQVEFIGEGKRWFDLVRYAERKQTLGNDLSNNAQRDMIGTFFSVDETKRMLQSRLKTRWSLYCPVYYREREASGNVLYQNPYWDNDVTTN